MTTHFEPDYQPTDGSTAAWADDRLAPVTTFDYDEIDRRLAGQVKAPEDPIAAAAVFLAQFWTWVFKGGNCTQGAFRRFVAAVAALRPDLAGNQTYAELGQLCGGATKALMSRYGLQFERTFNIKCSRSRPLTARQHMREKQLGHPPTNTGRNGKRKTALKAPRTGQTPGKTKAMVQ